MPDKEHQKSPLSHKLTFPYYGKVKEFVSSTKSKDFFLFAIAFLIATFFWFLRALNDTYETDIQIPVELINVPEEALITEPPVSQLTLTVKDKGSLLLLYQFGNRNKPIHIDFNKWRNNGSYTRINVSDIEKEIRSSLSNSTVLLNTKPKFIEYYYSIGERKKIPVRLNIENSTAIEYVATDTLLQPDSVWAFAPTHILASLQEVSTQKDSFLQISDTVHEEIALQKKKGVKFIPEKVEITIPTDLLVEKTIEIPVLGTGFPVDKKLRTFPSKVKLRFLIPFHQFKNVSEEDFQLEVPYEEIATSSATKYIPHVSKSPWFVRHLQMIPTSVEFLIENTRKEPEHNYSLKAY
ncbi:MAG: YbbR-like domain-containing protein [Bacteroidaceae bacterium]|jgi:hypothetical protein